MPLTNFARENAEKLNLRLERLEMFDELMNGFIKAGQRQAIIFKITKGGESIFEGTYGFNTKEYGFKMDTVFNVCSITKPVIAAFILCLQEDGVIDITEPVWKYLPEFTGGGYEDIQLWQLLTHSSGLKDEEIREGINNYLREEWGIAAPDDSTTKEEMEALDEMIKRKLQIPTETKGRLADIYYLLSLKVPMKHKPRSHMTYCSYGFNLLKDVIEAAAGESIDTYAERRLFGPLKMMDTAWKMPKMKWNKIIGRVDNAVRANCFNCEENYTSDSGAGGLKTTVEDFFKMAYMFLMYWSLDVVRVFSY
jgi:CubicO group peptidase (beta-lactamase class C family)